MQFSFELPNISDSRSSSREMREVKNYLFRLTEQLRYILSNLDGDNFSGDITGGIKAELNNTAASLRAQYASLGAELRAFSTRLSAAETSIAGMKSIKTGRVTVQSGTQTPVSFDPPFTEAPCVTACYAENGTEMSALAVSDVTASGAKISITGEAPDSADVYWIAVGR